MRQQHRQEQKERAAVGWRLLERIGVLILLLGIGYCLPLRPAAAQAVAPPQTQTPAPPATAPAAPGGNILEQIETTLTSIVREARPSIVSVEGHLSGANPFWPPPPRGSSASAIPGAPDFSHLPPGERAAREKEWHDRMRAQGAPGGMPPPPFPPRIRVTGSGFLIQGGFVVTTVEITKDVQDLIVILADGRRLKADWVNPDDRSNIAVLKLSGVDPALGLQWGDSSRAYPGCFTLTMGNQSGFPHSVSLGLVSGVGRMGRSGAMRYYNLIQFQGAVGYGGSGSPLLNSRGEVIGMTVATPGVPGNRPRFPDSSYGTRRLGSRESIPSGGASAPNVVIRISKNDLAGHEGSSTTRDVPRPEEGGPGRGFLARPPFMFGGISNTGFALPSNDMRPLVEVLCRREKPVHQSGWLGLGAHPAFGEMDPTAEGARVTVVYGGGPADRAGIQPGDIVLAINAQPVRSPRDLYSIIHQAGIGNTVHLVVLRGATKLNLTLVIGLEPDEDALKRMPRRTLPAQAGSSTSLRPLTQPTGKGHP